MRLLVTGGLGFIGSCFIRQTLRLRPGASIVNFDAMTYAGNLANCREVERSTRYRFIKGDICDEAAVSRALSGGVDAVVNFAAETHVDRSIADPAAFLRTDVFGTHVLLEAVRKHRVPLYLQVSTDEVYGEVAHGSCDEAAALRPRSPYSASKAAAEMQVLAYANTYGVRALITRGSNTYGPFQFPEKLIPLAISALLDGEPVPVYGDGLQVRDWIYVEDHAAGILAVLERGEPGNAYNIGGGNERTNIEIVRRLVEGCGGTMQTHVRYVQDRPGHDRRYAVNCAKIRALGWRPQTGLACGLRETIDWYRRNERWWRPGKNEALRNSGGTQHARDALQLAQ